MKEINKSELVEILEDCGVDVTEQGIRAADIDNFLSAELAEALSDELEPLYSIVCQEVMEQRPDLGCTNTGPLFKVTQDGDPLMDFEVVDAELDRDGNSADFSITSSNGEAEISIDNGIVSMDELLQRIEQAEHLP